MVGTEVEKDVKLVAVNTDVQALENSNAPHKLQIGKKLQKAKAVAWKPERGKRVALESYEEIKWYNNWLILSLVDCKLTDNKKW